MNRLFTLIALAAILVAPASAASKTVTLSVPGMTCAACPITVKKALNKVEGVSRIEVSLENREAVVTFDDQKANVQALIDAVTKAGYPTKLAAAQGPKS